MCVDFFFSSTIFFLYESVCVNTCPLKFCHFFLNLQRTTVNTHTHTHCRTKKYRRRREIIDTHLFEYLEYFYAAFSRHTYTNIKKEFKLNVERTTLTNFFSTEIVGMNTDKLMHKNDISFFFF